MKRKYLILSIAIITVGLLLAGGTYAYLTLSANVTNGNYAGNATCFNIDYSITNSDNTTQDITGTMFPSLGPSGGLSGRVGLNVNSSCDVFGTGTLTLSIDSATSSSLTTIASPSCKSKISNQVLSQYTTESDCTEGNGRWTNPTSYCESNTTLETLTEYTTSADCTSHNGTWVNGGSALKYAIYDNATATGSPIRVGHITSTDIGNTITIYDDFLITATQKYYHIFIWLDGNLTDNTFTDLPFAGQISAEASQNNYKLPDEYQQVEYIQSSGTQYIDTGIINSPTIRVTTIMSANGINILNGREVGGTNGRYKWGSNGNGFIYIGYGSNNYPTSITATINDFYTFDISNGSQSIKGSNNVIIGSWTDTTLTKYASSNIFLFNGAGDGTLPTQKNGNMRIKNCNIYDNNVLVRDYVPVMRKSDGEIGLYDRVNNVFYTNAGSGTFTKGSNVT